mmetsp:Transcript_4244/g.6316  ORF Transcript_4244/g.6316 Transcript_4244/m.6316 type:complete len:828 (-) Transcript_4244:169-2652(-)|eukprot:CAMPEP_0167744398 /NCGR_PEP_ID=MMETSP0110_2-20121227/2569_1 /TAXON_ID=629695 /ORGANISM="Gymnochlora sp., Strain CCMP2014" /LENGTH=827 /DNA_ID=CAMNT_0007628915 /DNA_START=56 /DNA_END=2539 /DNA_ORIENTATION=+
MAASCHFGRRIASRAMFRRFTILQRNAYGISHSFKVQIDTCDKMRGYSTQASSSSSAQADAAGSKQFKESYSIKGNVEYFDDITPPEGVTVIRDAKSAERVLKILYSKKVRVRFHACDTEVDDIDVDRTPIGQGYVTCVTIFCGDDIDFGNGPKLFVDNLDEAEGILMLFKKYLEDKRIKKVWHNYAFDRHVLFNHNIDAQGFAADTMQMARLWDSSRNSYKLETLAFELLEMKKVSMKERFSRQQLLRNGLPGKKTYLPPVSEIQRDMGTRAEFIDYATYDAVMTFHLFTELRRRLTLMPCQTDEANEVRTMWDYYISYWRPFGELLTSMEREGFRVRDEDYLPQLKEQAEKDIERHAAEFKTWAEQQIPEAKYMNVYSDQQKQQFFFAGHKESNLEPYREFKYPNTENIILEGEKRARTNLTFKLGGLGIKPITFTEGGKPQISSKILEELAGKPRDQQPQYGKAYEFFLKKCGKSPGLEENSEEAKNAAKQACIAIDSLSQMAFLTKMLNTFIIPLMNMADEKHRVHCSLGLNTETGRLSSRRPNLQNQPALEKDVYKIRHAFSCDPGNTLLVADYGQLELRVLAHMSRCESMIEAFREGGDFHSRTAIGMYPEVKQAVDDGEVLLEWDYSKGENPKPMLKDVFGSQRRKAKTLNFSIAYGKTAFGLSKDWGVSRQEAQRTVDLWYSDRPEVLKWQDEQQEYALRTGLTRTLMGRYRTVSGIWSKDQKVRSHYLRAAINTPIQGGAADIVMMAMLNIRNSTSLAQLGYRLLLQIHDEVILEGPKESADEALQLLKECMENPFEQPLLVDLVVDAQSAETWYEAK